MATRAEHSGCMVALYPPRQLAQELALDEGLPAEELHLTLAYLGEAKDVDVAKLKTIVAVLADTVPPITAKVNGIGFFSESHNNTPVTWASVDAPALPSVRERLVRHLVEANLPVSTDHGFTPHMTLAYADRRDVEVATRDLTFDQIWVVAGGEHTAYNLTGTPKPAVETARGSATFVMSNGGGGAGATWMGNGFTPYTFTTQVGGKTILTAPVAQLRTEKASANEHFLMIDGAYVGSEIANRNGALWTTADLEFGYPSVVHGPLNWLHDGRLIVGAITDAELVRPHEKAAETGREYPYIATTSAMWTWLYPEESHLVQQAAEWNKLWLSMECISENVLCTGDGGCNTSFPYMQMIRGQACEHLRERSSIRRLENPTFLGCALIVPPARPGWAFANASVKARAEALAEAAFDQAGHPPVSATEWEQLMAQVIAAAEIG